ncbi:MAG TPA: molybdenum cofactor biosynthesis protein MoaE [Spirochaetota bacterium]|nr:molybdenum cofactor biosynthesis protein MoaE [Spirochaetota bacterium]HPP49591.1 molybdenum cofactor biosynthesis protein MoaE [Spirochaetota bacterium]
MKLCTLQYEPIDVDALLAQCTNPSDGAVVCFIGRPRNIDNGREVLYLEYEAHQSMAIKELTTIMQKALEQFTINDCIVVHRLGRVEVGQASVVIIVTAMHRKEAFNASQFIIDELKKSVPIWKKEYFNDGSQWKSG